MRLQVVFHSKLDDVARRAVIDIIRETFLVDIHVQDLDPSLEELLDNFLVEWRGQYDAGAILEVLGRVYGRDIFIFVMPYDIFVEGLNFVFGVALYKIGTVMSTARFKGPKNLYIERIQKTVKHELGHVFGLKHCKNPCVMRFANSLLELDQKPKTFCNKCAGLLRELGVLKKP